MRGRKGRSPYLQKKGHFFVGDTAEDIIEAREAGFKTTAVT